VSVPPRPRRHLLSPAALAPGVAPSYFRLRALRLAALRSVALRWPLAHDAMLMTPCSNVELGIVAAVWHLAPARSKQFSGNALAPLLSLHARSSSHATGLALYLFASVAPTSLGCLLQCLLEELVLLRPPLVSATHDPARTRPGVWHAHTLARTRTRARRGGVRGKLPARCPTAPVTCFAPGTGLRPLRSVKSIFERCLFD
jgi:hypothetical protein